MIAVLEGGTHDTDHFKFDEAPTRILVQTKGGGGMSGRRARATIYQDTERTEDGCRVYSKVIATHRILNGLVETE
jgi:hypothetical protein